MRAAAKLTIIGTLGTLFSLGNSWFKTKEAKEKLAKEAEKLKEKETLLEKKVELLNKSLNKTGKLELEQVNNNLKEINAELTNMRTEIPQEGVLDHLHNLTQQILSNYIDLMQKNFASWKDFWSMIDTKIQSIIILMIILLFISIYFYYTRNMKFLPKERQGNNEKMPYVNITIYNKGDNDKLPKIEEKRE